MNLGLIGYWCEPCGWFETEDWPTDETAPANAAPSSTVPDERRGRTVAGTVSVATTGHSMEPGVPSPLDAIHSVGSGHVTIRAVVHREVRGRRDWGGTAAYKYGMDVAVAIHCARCCCEPTGEADACPAPALGHYVAPYNRGTPGDWLEQARHRGRDHAVGFRHKAR